MKRKVISVLLAAMISVSGAASINAYTEQELMQAQEYTKYALNETYAALNNLWAQKQELEYEISVLDQNLVQVMVSVDVLTSDIAAKEQDISLTSQNLEKAKNAQAEQYEAMKQRIQYLYENGGDDAWFEMLLNGDDIGDMLTRGEYTQKMYESDKENLEKFKNTAEQVAALKDRYESEQAELEEMKASLEEEQANLEYQLYLKRTSSQNCEYEIAVAQQQATTYTNLLAAQQKELEKLQIARWQAEQEAIRQAQLAQIEEYNRQQAAAAAGTAADDSGQTTAAAAATTDSTVASVGASASGTTAAANTGSTAPATTTTTTTTSSGSSTGSAIVNFATQYVGNPYVWGGTSLTSGADCSGFVQSVYRNFGINLPRTSYEQQNVGTEVSYANAQPGDLICYGGHVAIYMGNGKIVHASNSRDGIKISNDATYRTILSVRRLTGN